MSKEQTNYRVVRELISFTSATEGDLSSLSKVEVDERLRSQGIDPQELSKATQRRLLGLRNEMAARRALHQATLKSQNPGPAKGNFAFAARTEEVADAEDLEILGRLAQPDLEESDSSD